MNKFNVSLVIFLIFSSFIYAQNNCEFINIGKIKNGWGDYGEIRFDPGMAGGVVTPNSLYVNEFDKIIYILNRDKKFVNSYSNSNLKFYDSMHLNSESYKFAYSIIMEIKGDNYIGSHSTRFRLWNKKTNIFFESSENGLWGNRSESMQNYFSIGDYIFYYDPEGYVRALDFEANFLNREEALEQLKYYNREYLEKNKQTVIISIIAESLLKAGKSIILGNEFYSVNTRENFNYYKLLDDKFNYDNPDVSGLNFIGYDDHHNSYLDNEVYGEQGKSAVTVFSKEGEHLVTFRYDQMYEDWDKDVRPTFYVTEPGNLYFMFPHQDGTRFYKVNRTWGEPSLVAVAINGLEGDSYSKYVMEVLATMDKDQLRILRNTMFAMEGYKFKSEELTMHFNQYEWYKPNESVQASASNLSEAQQKLIEEIRRLEQE